MLERLDSFGFRWGGKLRDFLLEIGTEELPASYLDMALEWLSSKASRRLEELRLSHGKILSWGTPRRIALVVEDVAEVQPDREEEVLGPPERVAFDERGNPTKAAVGFAKAQGVSLEELKVVDTPKGRYVSVTRRSLGSSAREILASEVPNWIRELPFPKSMRWGELELKFARPIRWIVALWGDQVLDFQLDSIRSGRTTFGHRFMSPNGAEVPSPRHYLEICRSLKVLVDPGERSKRILEESEKAARALGGRVLEDPDLLKTVVNLVEYPVIVVGRFSEEFLELPREVLVTVMKEQQKFFGLEDSQGNLLPHFISVANICPPSLETIRRGNERVLKARLSDARFFFKEDQKRRLEERLEKLEGMIFHAKLGTLKQKVERLERLSHLLAQAIAPQAVAKARRAATLCKADLATEMVGEFPTLQGTMGSYYALLQGEDTEVAQAIREHYLPAFSGDRIPAGPVSVVVALADKLDTVAGCFSVGEVPTGAGDPLGVRRAALGILRILLEGGLRASLRSMVRWALDSIESQLGRLKEGVEEEILKFFVIRLENLWISQGHDPAAVSAIVDNALEDLPQAMERLEALERFMGEENFNDLALSFKRVMNIVGDRTPGPVDESLFTQPEERDLMDLVNWTEVTIPKRLAEHDALAAMKELASQRPRIDRFFDKVLVNDPDTRLRSNRLNMLARLASSFLKLADFSKLAGRA